MGKLTKESKKSWREKAVNRQKENKLLKKKIRELTTSRDIWKNKWTKEKQEKQNLTEMKKK